ncbi:DUF7507 domain-containing protein [Methanosarcina horonobensis]|uniref:DUF7507 domain-containing protein n=1 Tax=Methanosarcina horonobensis TaxID=418008 RepID=UPI00373FD75F
MDVNNTGNIDLTNVSVSDPLLVNLTGPFGDNSQTGILNVGENWTYTGTYTVTQADLNDNGGGDGFINNTAIVDCNELDQESDSAEVLIEQNPAYGVSKIVIDVAGRGPEANTTSAGDIISYQINVTNYGNIDLTNLSVDDPLISLTGPVESLTTDGILKVGEYWIYTGNYTVTQSDLNSNYGGNGYINNMAAVDCDELDSQNDSVAVPIEQSPAYIIDKTVTDVAGKGSSANITKSGDIISYRIDVNNTGNIDLTNVSVSDPLLVNLTGPSGDNSQVGVLNVGENWTYTGTYTVTQADLNSNGGGDGFINNTATVDCDELGSQNDSVAVSIVQTSAYMIDKTVTDVSGNGSLANVTKAGDVISFQINVTNDGNLDLTNVSVGDSLINLTGPIESLNTDEVLEVSESWIYTGNYTVTQADLNSNGGGDGFINNTATVDCTELDPENDSVAVPIEKNPVCTIKKIVVDIAGNGPAGNISSAGDIIGFQVNVTNSGNIDLTNISVSDSLVNFTGPYGDVANFLLFQPAEIFRSVQNGDGVLSVGETWYYIGNYTVTQEDLNNNGGGDGFLNSTVTFISDETEPMNSSTIQYINDSGNESGNISPGIYIERNPNCSIYKSVLEVVNGENDAVNDAGDIIRYGVLVINEGNVELTGVSVNDPMISLVGPSESKTGDGVLEVGENWTYTGNYTVTHEDMDSNGGGDGDIDNTAIISCNELSNKTSSVEVQLIVPGDSSHGSGTGRARVVSGTAKNDEVNETPVKGNGTRIKFEEETEYVEENTGNYTVKPQTASEETAVESISKLGKIFWTVCLFIACLVIVFLYKRRPEDRK